MIVESISSLLSDFPDISSAISPKMLSTKPNESFFSSAREQVLNPSPLEMACIFPKIVGEHVKRVVLETTISYTTLEMKISMKKCA